MDLLNCISSFKVEKYRDDGSTTKEACKLTGENIGNIYLAASIGTIHPQKIIQKVEKLQNLKRDEEMRAGVNHRTGKVRDQGKQKKKSRNQKVKLKFGDVINQLFDVANEVPERERKFYEDQKTDRKMFIGKVDKEVTSVLNEEVRQELVKEAENARLEEKRVRNANVIKEREEKEAKKREERLRKVDWKEVELEDSEAEEGLIKKRRRMSKEDTGKLGDLLAHCERFNVSETGISAIYNLQKEQEKTDHRLSQSQVHRKKKLIRIKNVKTFEN